MLRPVTLRPLPPSRRLLPFSVSTWVASPDLWVLPAARLPSCTLDYDLFLNLTNLLAIQRRWRKQLRSTAHLLHWYQVQRPRKHSCQSWKNPFHNCSAFIGQRWLHRCVSLRYSLYNGHFMTRCVPWTLHACMARKSFVGNWLIYFVPSSWPIITYYRTDLNATICGDIWQEYSNERLLVRYGLFSCSIRWEACWDSTCPKLLFADGVLFGRFQLKIQFRIRRASRPRRIVASCFFPCSDGLMQFCSLPTKYA